MMDDNCRTFSHEDLRSELKQFNNNLPEALSEATIPLGEDLRCELQLIGQALQKDLAGVAEQVQSMLVQDFQRVLGELQAIRELQVAQSQAFSLGPPEPPGGRGGSKVTTQTEELAKATPNEVWLAGPHAQTMPEQDARKEPSTFAMGHTISAPKFLSKLLNGSNSQLASGNEAALSGNDILAADQSGFGELKPHAKPHEGEPADRGGGPDLCRVHPEPDPVELAVVPSGGNCVEKLDNLASSKGVEVAERRKASSERTSNEKSGKAQEPSRNTSRVVSAHSRRKSIDYKKAKTLEKLPTSGSLGGAIASSLQRWSLKIVSQAYFDYFVTSIILLNGVLVGAQTHWMARHLSDNTPTFFQVLEYIFAVIFTLELLIRLVAFRCTFFTKRGDWAWNCFDFVIVLLQIVEIVMGAAAAGLGISFNILRILRLVRVVRLARALRLIGELRTIVSSIAGSMKSLLWTGVLLFMIVYVLGVGFTQMVLTKRLKMKDDGDTIPEDLEKWWGDLVASIFSLFEAITGGVDWEDVVRPLIDHVGWEMGVLFSMYITFTVLAMLNVVTGVFIESVMKNASLENELRTTNHICSLFRTFDVDENGEMTWDMFENQLDKKEMKEFFKTIDVDITNARSLFELLDIDESGSVNADEFVDGCLRIWAPTKGMDLSMIRRDVKKLDRDFQMLLDQARQDPPSPSSIP